MSSLQRQMQRRRDKRMQPILRKALKQERDRGCDCNPTFYAEKGVIRISHEQRCALRRPR